MTEAWERRLADAWAAIDDYDGREDEFRERIDALAAELPDDDPVAAYERGGSWDSTGVPDRAIEFYRAALAHGLDGSRRRQCVVQLASSLRNLGEADESVRLLQDEVAAGSDDLDDAVRGFLALAMADAGREREAVSVALGALAGHLTRYRRSLTNYARALVEPD